MASEKKQVKQKKPVRIIHANQEEILAHQNYFETKIKPKLNSQIKYVGELSQGELSNFYGSAKACLYPINWEEPFGLIMAESMACGTPVIAFDRGSAREVVENGKTGFVVKNIKEAVEVIKKIGQIDRMACRKRVENLFSYQRMVSDYEKVYQEILSGQEIKYGAGSPGLGITNLRSLNDFIINYAVKFR